MNIQVRVINGNARSVLRSLRSDIDNVNRALGDTNKRSALSGRGMTSLGNQIQWTGRQIQTNFTLPLIAAGAAAVHWQLQNEQAMTRVAKVYGDASLSAATMKNELHALSGAFEELSNHFGVQQSEVIGIAGDWAAAGASGLALAKSVKLTLETMVLGEMDAAEATQALIAIQAQYGFSTTRLAETIGYLNAVENQTGISMKGLIQGFARSAGVARQAGVDVRHLAAMLAAISPAAGGAAEAGNALKTIFSRLASPTRETSQVLNLMGISMKDLEWKSSTATEQLQIMSKKFKELSDKQKEVVSTVVASRWQINKFSILMRELSSENGYYQKALDATASRQHVFNLYQKELNTVLSSNPRRLQIIWTMMQNAATDIIQPMIPLLLYVANSVRMVVQAFSSLDPALQKLILFGLVALAFVGPFVRYVGSLLTLIGALVTIVSAMAAPFIAGFAAIGTGAAAFAKGIGFVWTTIMVNLRAITYIGMAWIQGVWAAGMFGLRPILSLVGMIIASRWATLMAALPRTMAAAQILMRTIWINGLLALAAAQIVVGALLTRAWLATMRAQAVITSVAGTAIRAAYTGLMLSIAAISSVVYPLVVRMWTAMMTGVFIVVNAWSRFTTMIYRAFAMGLTPISVAAGALLTAAWTAITTAVQYVLLAGTIAYTAIWRLFAFGLAPITAAAGRLLTAAWVATMRAQMIVMAAAQRAWALAWSGMVAIAAAGSRAIALVTTMATGAITLLAAFPGRVAALFRGGWALLLIVARAGLAGLASLITGAVGAISWPVVAVIAAVVLLIAGFWDQIQAIWNNIVNYFSNSGNSLVTAVRNTFGSLGSMMSRVFNKLPESVKNAMLAVVSLVAAAARKVYELFSYINPFAHHSPSLVENVTNGMAIVRKQFATLSEVEGYVKSAYATISAFGRATAGLASKNQAADFAEKRASIVKQSPSAGPAFDSMVAQINKLTPVLNQLKSAVAAQQAVVDQWSKALDDANAKLDVQQDKLEKLKKVADDLQNQLDAAKSTLDTWADTPIQGQQAMSDAIFDNTMAQKKLQLQMMEMEKITGPLDDIKSKMSAINGQMDQLQGMRTSLQQGGAGSDILKFYDDQLAGLQGQSDGLGEQAKALQDMQDQLDELARKGQELDLQNSIQFDPLIRQIEQASKDMKEMPFDTIMAGIKGSKAEVDSLTDAYNKANAEVEKQQKVVDAATAARDAIQKRYDEENKKLQTLKDSYDKINQAIQDITNSLNDMASAADAATRRATDKKAKKKGGDSLSPGAQNFIDAAGGNFPDPGMDAAIGREGGIGDQSSAIDDFTKDLAKQTSGMFAGLNPLGPLKKWWDKAWSWLKKYIGPLFSGLGDFIGSAFEGMGDPFGGAMSGWMDSIKGFVDTSVKVFGEIVSGVSTFVGQVWGFIQGFWDFAQPIFEHLWDGIVDGLKKMWDKIGPQLAAFGDLVKPVGDAISNLWTLIGPIIGLIFADLAAGVMLVVDIIAHTIGPVLETIGAIIGGVIRIIRGVIEFLVGVFTLDWDMAWKGITDIFGGVWDIIAGIVTGAWNIVVGILVGALDWVGHVFAFIWNKVKGPFKDAWDWITKKLTGWKDSFVGTMRDLSNWLGTKLANAWKPVSDWWSSTWGTIKKNAIGAKDAIIKPFVDMYNWISSKLTGVMGTMSAKWKEKWTDLKKWFNDAKKWISDPLKDGINFAISAINLLISGLNKVADLLPGLDWHISPIPKLAAGGGIPTKHVGGGFKTTGPRAIVGEGNQRYPEYVIPTDPMYRGRAFNLLGGLTSDLGIAQSSIGGVPAYKGGGILGSIGDAIGSAGNFFKGLGDDLLSHISDGVASYIVDPFFKMADPWVSKINWKFVKGMWNAGKAKIKDWLSFTDDAAKEKYEEGGAAGIPAGKLKTWITKALGIIKESLSLSKGVYNIAMHESGGNPRAINLTDSNAKAGHPSKGVMQTIDGTFNAYSIKGHKDIWNPVDNIIAGTRYAISRYGRKWLQKGGNRDKNGNYIGYEMGGILGSIPSLAQGAYIRRKAGGTIVRVGEGQHDEAVLPLPRGAQDLKGGTTNNFYGDLSFPNIKSGDDAQAFLDNLETLTAGK
jgi:TP901 family phage tail tape measure protein